MPAKAPIYLKNAGGNKGNKKLREILSTDMISAPLGDFRHTAHVGRGGSRDMFGDTSFIPNQDCLTTMLQNPSDTSKEEIDGNELVDQSSRDETVEQPEDQSNALQSALSLPHLKSTDNGNIPESSQTLSKVYSKSHENVSKIETASESPPSSNETEHNVMEGPPKPKRVLSKVSHSSQSEPSPLPSPSSSTGLSSPSHAPTENLDNSDDWKFELDMGPSLVDEIMGIIEMTGPNQ